MRLFKTAPLIWLVVGLALVLAAFSAVLAVKAADRRWAGETLKDWFAVAWWGEAWEGLPPVGRHADYRWVEDARPVRVAHALGASGEPTANTLSALEAARRAGFRIAEVDLWLDETTGVVHCHHGPNPPAAGRSGCTIDLLAAALQADPLWLVLDIKTDFASTGSKALATLAAAGVADRAVVQLYLPQDVPVFAAWAARYPLPGPLITAYRSHRSLRGLAGVARDLGIRVLTVPIERSTALGSDRANRLIFVHPVHDCAQFDLARSVLADGIYTLNALQCK